MPLQLQYLTDDEQVIELCTHFWEIDEENRFVYKVSELGNLYGKNTSQITSIVYGACNAFSPNNGCLKCNTPYTYTSRTDFQQRVKHLKSDWLCPDCKTYEEKTKMAALQAERERLQKIIEEHYPLKSVNNIDLMSLSIEEAVYLLSLIRVGMNEDFSLIRPLSQYTPALTPSNEFDNDIIIKLVDNQLIAVHPISPPEAFIFENEVPTKFYLAKASYTLTIGKNTQESKKRFEELERIFREKRWPASWYGEYLPLWRRIALEESIQHLILCLNDHGLSLQVGDKTRLVLSNVLEKYSVAQAFTIIWSRVQNAAAFYMRGGVTKAHAANTVIGAIQNYFDRACAEGWPVKASRRDRRRPQSIISHVLYNVVLQISEDGFNTPPRLLEHLNQG